MQNRKDRKVNEMKAMLETLVIEMSQEYLREFEGELRSEIETYCETEVEARTPTIDYYQLACEIDTSDLAYEIEICPSDVAEYVDTCDVASYIEVEATDVADHICRDELAGYINVEDLVADEIRGHMSDFDFEDEVETAIGRLGIADLDYDHIAQEVADRLSFDIEVSA